MVRYMGGVLTGIVVLLILVEVIAPFHNARGLRAGIDHQLAGSDFGAFYCGAVVVRDRANPYALEPLKRCEVERVYAPSGSGYADHGIDPAPLPPYAFAFFAPFTLLPYGAAGLVWTAAMTVALFASALALHRLTTFPLWTTLSFLAITGGIDAIDYGQTQPLMTLALLGAALFLRAGRERSAALVASVLLLEPHIAVAPLLALAIFSKGRWVTIGTTLAAIGIATAIAGPSGMLAYATSELPAHAFTEFTLAMQYSFTALLWALGTPDAVALRLGSLQMAVVVATSLLAVPKLVRRLGPETIVLFPAACAVLGGPFMHIQQIGCALPFALFLAARYLAVRPMAIVATTLIALPWGSGSRLDSTLAFPVLCAAVTLVLAAPIARRATTIAAATVLYLALVAALHHLPSTPLRALESPSVVATAGYDPSLASTQWAVEARSTADGFGATVAALSRRVPTWAGLATLLVLGLTIAGSRKPASGADTAMLGSEPLNEAR